MMAQKIIDFYLRLYPFEGVSLKKRVGVHLLFWVFLIIFQFLIAYTDWSLKEIVLEIVTFVLKAIIVFYGLTYFAFPKLFSKDGKILGVSYLILVYCLLYLLNYGYYAFGLKYSYFNPETTWYNYAFKFTQKGIEGLWNPVNIFFEFLKIYTDLGIAFIVKFSRIITKYAIRAQTLGNENNQIEMAFLRNQLNPHFLLNSLNNIYSQVITQDSGSKKSIMVLSDLMKYIFYNSGETLVDLQSEILFLKDYIELEKLKGNRYLEIKFTQEGRTDGYKIAPLILINYIENAFKYAASPSGSVSLAEVNIKFSNGILIAKIENDYIEKLEAKSKEGGVGLENTKKRLALLYPENHGLTITKENKKFLVELWLKLKSE